MTSGTSSDGDLERLRSAGIVKHYDPPGNVRRLLAFAPLVLAVALVAACSGDDVDVPQEQATVSAATPAPTPSPTATALPLPEPFSSDSVVSTGKYDCEESGEWIRDPRLDDISANAMVAGFLCERTIDTPFVRLDFAHLVTVAHSGSGNFVVGLFDSQGALVELLFDEIGGFEGTKAFRVPGPGRYSFAVEADGTWVLQVNISP